VDTIRTREYDAWNDRLVSTRTICDIFGSWGKALQAAGLRSERTAKLQLREMVEAFKRHVGRSTMRHRPGGNSKHIWRSTGILSGGQAIVAHMEVIWSWPDDHRRPRRTYSRIQPVQEIEATVGSGDCSSKAKDESPQARPL
jgi:hypothetical protein